MKKYTVRRAIAYVIDFLIIALITGLISGISFINPYNEEYKTAYTEYNELYDEYQTALINNGSELEILQNETIEAAYLVSLYSGNITLIEIILGVIFFIIVKYFNNGQTIGMKILKIRQISTKSEKLTITQIIVNSILIYSLLSTTVLYIILVCFTKETYILSTSIITLIDSLFILTTVLLMIFRKDGKGLHDLIAGTTVIGTNETKEAIIEEKSSAKTKIKEIKTINPKKKIIKKGEK